MFTFLPWFAGVAVLSKHQVAGTRANVVLKVVVVRAFVAATLRVAMVNRAFRKNTLSSAMSVDILMVRA